LPLREPFSVAKAISTASIVTGGRLRVGVGVGWQQDEFEIIGQEFSNRGKRTDEMLEVIRELMTGRCVSYYGKYFQFEQVSMVPAGKGCIPVYVGGISDAALERAARHDGWVGGKYPIEEIERIAAKLNQNLTLFQGSRAQRFEMITCIRELSANSLRRAEAAGITAIYRDPWLDKNGHISGLLLKEKLADMGRFSQQYIHR
jgi:alkanesulfonate monooxygenase SsuD/methylene tetrahydromethanopterin reductase-like flavin-dependent oxidoreductase (luciferase family)